MIDISWPLRPGMVSYKDRRPLVIEQLRTVPAHGVADSLCARLHMHAGTHVDAPSHFIEGGPSIEQLSLLQMNGRCRIIDLTYIGCGPIKKEHLLPLRIVAGERLLFKTVNSMYDAQGDYRHDETYLSACAADYLATFPVALVGVDALGLERCQPEYGSHLALFNAGIIVVEGLRLAAAKGEGVTYNLLLLPLAFVGTEAAPARAILMVA